MPKQKKDIPEYEQQNEKTAGNNQWTNANLKYYPDERERKDGPGGDEQHANASNNKEDI